MPDLLALWKTGQAGMRHSPPGAVEDGAGGHAPHGRQDAAAALEVLQRRQYQVLGTAGELAARVRVVVGHVFKLAWPTTRQTIQQARTAAAATTASSNLQKETPTHSLKTKVALHNYTRT